MDNENQHGDDNESVGDAAFVDYDLEELEDEIANSENLNRDDLFFVTLLVYKRQFKGQSSGTYVARWELSAGSNTEFLHKVWNLSKGHLAREILFVPNVDGTSSPSWSSNEVPIESEFHKFVLFQSGRRNYTLDKLSNENNNLLQSWRDKEISLYLHIYSLSISSRAVWNSVKDVLIDPAEKDRSGAALTQAVFELSDNLRSTHGNHLEGHGMAWSFWANSILNAPAHLRETMKNYPPQHLSHLFRAKEGPRISAIKRELNVAHSVNNSFHEEITSLRQAFDVLDTSFEHLRGTMNIVKHRLEALEIRDKLSENLINAMESSTNVQEDQQGKTLSMEITDTEDVDHIETFY
ncbi:uncharacterized protein LOC128739731 [Sabethes cyaneus]|uniref:uncharacterized protein LOC128739731 n=1 Tax=Sabethes cyaneus TaxID=53552 RepID=UPI00237D9FCA|nr:uncharacterized protein LOC128739731 [Sabethes cyaneus]